MYATYVHGLLRTTSPPLHSVSREHILIGVCAGVGHVLRELHPEPLWTDATKVLSERVDGDVVKSLNVAFSRGEFINIQC